MGMGLKKFIVKRLIISLRKIFKNNKTGDWKNEKT
jgi:hypothetical protein